MIKHSADKANSTVAKPALAFCLAFVGVALSQTMLGPMVPVIRVTYDVSLAQNGLLPFAQGAGCLAAGLIGIFVADKYDKRKSMILAYAVYNAMLYVTALLPPYWMLVALFFIIGTGARLCDALLNANMAELDANRKGFFLNLLHGFFGIGALVGPIIASAMLTGYGLGSSLLSIACLSSVLFLCCLLLVKNGKRTSPAEKTPKSSDQGPALPVLLKSRTMWTLGLCTTLYVGFAIAMATWIPSYFMEMGMGSFFAASVVSFLWAGIIAGRFVYSVLSLRFSMKKLIFVSSLVGGAVIIAASVVNTVEFLAVAYAIAGFFTGAVVPLCIAIANKEFPGASGRISSIIIIFVALGIMTVPGIIGLIAENVSFYTAIFILNLCPIFIAALSFSLKVK
ncbi:MAG: MFS transporter [Clostridiales bacterium]|nr:MFS transporter [Clostridiales bacterium]